MEGWASMSRFEGLLNTEFGFKEQEEMKAYLRYYRFELPHEVEHRWGRIGVDGVPIFQHHFEREGAPTCLLLHGYLDHSGIYGSVVTELLAEGWSVTTFDLPGHGLSGGGRGDVLNFQIYQDCLNAVLLNLADHPTAVIGHSTGAAVLANSILDGQSFKHVALVSPLLHSKAWALSKVGARLLPKKMRIPRRRAHVSSDPEFQVFRTSDPLYEKTMPMTWVHSMFEWADEMESKEQNPAGIVAFFGGRDVIIDQRASAQIYGHLFPKADIRWFPGGNHHLLFEADEIRTKVRRELYDSIAPGLGSV